MATCGVKNFGCTLANGFGNSPSLAPANNILGMESISPPIAPNMETAVPVIIKVIPALPKIIPATAAKGASLCAVILLPIAGTRGGGR